MVMSTSMSWSFVLCHSFVIQRQSGSDHFKTRLV
jgi:hypothetical protein